MYYARSITGISKASRHFRSFYVSAIDVSPSLFTINPDFGDNTVLVWLLKNDNKVAARVDIVHDQSHRVDAMARAAVGRIAVSLYCRMAVPLCLRRNRPKEEEEVKGKRGRWH